MQEISSAAIEVQDANWAEACSVSVLAESGKKKVRLAGKQVVLFQTKSGIRACDNRCPHEGYPLSEGSLSDGDSPGSCLLTCNWHNWKFDLETGENCFGGDRLTVYPVEVRGDGIWVDVADPPPGVQQNRAKENLRSAFDDYAYDRIGREIARLGQAGADPLDALRLSIGWSWDRMEFGWTHAYAGMADWISLYEAYDGDAETRLVCLMEAVSHAAFDVLRERAYPYPEGAEDWDEAAFLAAVEREDEASAIRLTRGAIKSGLGFGDLEPALSQAALAHYNDFGHSLIYVVKAGQLIAHLGTEQLTPLTLSLVRSLVYASREDQIPEFRRYRETLNQWEAGGNSLPALDGFTGLSVNQTLDAVVQSSQAPALALFQRLLHASASNLLQYNIAQQDKTHVSVSGNVGWLDFTHGITFANAVRDQCTKYPALWPAGLLQMACFSGRNTAFTAEGVSPDAWLSQTPEESVKEAVDRAINHDQPEHIVSVHLLKTALAVQDELQGVDPLTRTLLAAGLCRFIGSPLRRRNPRRTAYQSMRFLSD